MLTLVRVVAAFTAIFMMSSIRALSITTSSDTVRPPCMPLGGSSTAPCPLRYEFRNFASMSSSRVLVADYLTTSSAFTTATIPQYSLQNVGVDFTVSVHPTTKTRDASVRAPLILRMLVIWLPRWKWTSCRQSAMSRCLR